MTTDQSRRVLIVDDDSEIRLLLATALRQKALVLDEGINLWHQKGYPVTAAEGVKPPALEPHNHGHGHDHHGHGH